MLFTTHLCTGALLGRLLPPGAAFATGVVSHLAMDRVPHWGNDDPAAFLRAARIDGLTALAVAAVLWRTAPAGTRTATLAGMAGAGLPDLDKPSRHFAGTSPFPAAFDRFHAGLQDGREFPRLLWVDAITTAIALTALHLARASMRSAG